MQNFLARVSLCLVLLALCRDGLHAQAELEPWGNITGIRIDGQLMNFETNLSLISDDWSKINATAKERQRPRFSRHGDSQFVRSNIDSLYFSETVVDAGRGVAKVLLTVSSHADIAGSGAWYVLTLPAKFAGGRVKADQQAGRSLSTATTDWDSYLKNPVKNITFSRGQSTLSFKFNELTRVVFKKMMSANEAELRLFIAVNTERLMSAKEWSKNLVITADGPIDRKPVVLALDTAHPGRVFDGFGGNFRLQNPSVDPQVIDYCLKNLTVKWGRVEMPWRNWQPAIDSNPIDVAKAGRIHPHVKESMEMAQRLYKMGMPVILTAWAPPAWAIVGTPKFRPGADGVWGNPLDHSKDNEIYKSITDYIIYLREVYGVQITDFSFNESDLGINIRQTGEEHAALIKGLGAYFKAHGLSTKLLLGDNSDANTFKFIDAAMDDPETHQYIGAVSFHSWRGWDSLTLQHWADAATRMQLPLLVGEGSIDAAAWAYPAIFQEQTYALKEINLYTRILAICQPASILQWQLTSDYSPVIGGGVYRDTSPMRPTQRFWNLKQLAAVPAGLQAMKIVSSAENISAAALGDNGKGIYSIQLVNNATARTVRLTGLPATVSSLRVYVTDKNRGMKEMPSVSVKQGKAVFTLEATSYTKLESL